MHLFPFLLTAAPALLAWAQPQTPGAAPPSIIAPPSPPPFEFQAVGTGPSWFVLVSSRRIAFVVVAPNGQGRGDVTRTSFQHVTRQHTADLRRWRAGEGTQMIAVEARSGACRIQQRTFDSIVTVRFNGRELRGCGGNLMRAHNR